MASPRPQDDVIEILRDALSAAKEIATQRVSDGEPGETARQNIADALDRAKEFCTLNVRTAINDLQDSLNSPTRNLENTGLQFVAFVNALPSDLHTAVRGEIEALSGALNTKRFAVINDLPVAPQPATPPVPPHTQPLANPEPPANPEPLSEAERKREIERRQEEARQTKDLQVARANWAASNARREVSFSKVNEFNKPSEGSSIESGTWTTDVDIEPGIYRIDDPSDTQSTFWLEVNNDKTITVNSAASTGYAMDFFMQKGALDLTLDFKKPGPDSLAAVLTALDEAAKRPGVKLDIGEGLKTYIKGLNKSNSHGLSAQMRTIKKRIVTNTEMKAGFEKWMAEQNLTKKDLNEFDMARLQLEYLVNHHNENAEKQRTLGTLPSYQEVVNYKGRTSALEETNKLATQDGSPPAKTQVFGENFDAKSPKDNLDAVGKEMSAVQERMANLDKEIVRLNKEMKAEIEGRLTTPDARLLEHVYVVDQPRNDLIEQISRERKDLADRLDVCKQEMDRLGSRPDVAAGSDERKKLDELQQQHHDLHAPASADRPAGAAVRMEDGVRQAEQAAQLLSPEEVRVRYNDNAEDRQTAAQRPGQGAS